MPNKQINQYDEQTTLLADDSLPMQTALGVTKRVEIGSIIDCYGMLLFSGTGTDHNPTTTPENIVDFDQELSSTGITASHANDNLTINSDGAYSVYIHIEANVADEETYTLYLAKNGTELASAPVDIDRKVGELSISSTAIIANLVSGDILDYYVASTNAGGASFIPTYLKLILNKVGV